VRTLAILVLVAAALHAGTALADTKRAPGLSAEELRHLSQMKESAANKAAEVKKLVKQRSRELRTKRRPRGKR